MLKGLIQATVETVPIGLKHAKVPKMEAAAATIQDTVLEHQMARIAISLLRATLITLLIALNPVVQVEFI